ncbi:MAG: TAXI family TRAP transporter solute-binding subunit [Pyramidobacter sp.]|nr:TAXI family TRAP transporter solute-binding subunit [Pyramidobacter sp.]
MKKIFAVCLVLCTVLAGAAMADTPQQLKFMAGPPGGNWFALGGGLADMWSKEVMQTTSITGGAVANIINSHMRKGDLGFSNTSMLAVAQKGTDLAIFKRVCSNAKMLANLYTQYTYFIARKDFAEKHGVTTVDDIVNKKLPIRFATLKTGTGSEFVVKAVFESGYGIDYRKAIKEWGGSVEYASYSGGADLIADNHLDVFAFSVGKVAAIVMQIESQTDVVILGMSQEALDKVGEAIGTVTFTVDPGIYKSVTKEPVKVVGDYTCIVVRGDLDDKVVYDLCKAMYENVDMLAKGVVDIKELDPKTAIPASSVVSHPGAVKYWTEAAAAKK